MIDIKNKIIMEFVKKDIDIESWNYPKDEHIQNFILELNRRKNISITFSCEGHKDGDMAYVLFSVNEIGWDILWNKIVPELSYKFSYLCNKDIFDTRWQIDMDGSGISLNSKLFGNMWRDQKNRFWEIVSGVFLQNFNT